MKTLLLTSAGMKVKEEILRILPKPANQIKLAHIITASKVEEDTSYMMRDRQQMIEVGFQVEDIDIEGKSEDEIRNLLRDKDIIYIQGGNTFYLLKYVKESGFDKVIKELIKKGMIYIGVSAGSYIACPTIEMATWKHLDKNIIGLTNLTALDLVPFLITAHYKPEYYSIIKKAILHSKCSVKILTDEQAILVKNGEIKLVGEGKEIKINNDKNK